MDSQEKQIFNLEKEKQEIMEKSKKLTGLLYSERNKIRKLEELLKASQEETKKMENQKVKEEEKRSDLEIKANQLKEEVARYKQENDSLKLMASAGNLLAQEKETKLTQEIIKLKEKLEMMSSSSNEDIKNHLLNVEAELARSNADKKKLEQEVILLQERVKAKNDAILQHNPAELFESLKREFNNQNAYEVFKKEFEKDKEALNFEIKTLICQKQSYEEEIRSLREENNSLSKKIVRINEKMMFLEEATKKQESMFNVTLEKIRQVCILL